MPNFPLEIQDLISRMLTVDPNQRIRIDQIKEHPGFRMFLPPNYVVPTPFAISIIPDPIDSSLIDDTIMSVLTNIGYDSPEEVVQELTSDKHSMAKVFFRMYTHHFSLESLSWKPEATSDQENAPTEVYQMPAMAPPMAIYPNQDPFYRNPKVPDVSSPDVYSLAHRVSWGGVINNDRMTINLTENFENLPTPIERILAPVETYLSENGYYFYHPDQFTIYARRADVGLYVVIKIYFQSADSFTMKVSRASNGQENEFGSLVNDISSIVDSNIEPLLQGS